MSRTSDEVHAPRLEQGQHACEHGGQPGERAGQPPLEEARDQAQGPKRFQHNEASIHGVCPWKASFVQVDRPACCGADRHPERQPRGPQVSMTLEPEGSAKVLR